MYLQLYAELYHCTMLIGWLVLHLGSFITPLMGWTYNVFRPSYDPSDLTHQEASILIDPGSTHSYITPRVVEICAFKKVKHRKYWLVQLAIGTK